MAAGSRETEKNKKRLSPQRAKSYPQRPDFITQVKNTSTGHWVVRDSRTGRFVAGKSDKPFKNIRVYRFAQAAPNPSISQETAILAEKAVLEFLNENS